LGSPFRLQLGDTLRLKMSHPYGQLISLLIQFGLLPYGKAAKRSLFLGKRQIAV